MNRKIINSVAYPAVSMCQNESVMTARQRRNEGTNDRPHSRSTDRPTEGPLENALNVMSHLGNVVSLVQTLDDPYTQFWTRYGLEMWKVQTFIERRQFTVKPKLKRFHETCLLSGAFPHMEGIQQRQESALGVLKAKTEEEFLVKIGAKEEEVGVFSLYLHTAICNIFFLFFAGGWGTGR